MKKIIFTLLSILIIVAGFSVGVSAQETEITKEYLQNELGLTDDEIVAKGLAFVYDVGDTVVLHGYNENEYTIETKSGYNSIVIQEGNYSFEFEVAGKGFEKDNYLTLISKNVIFDKSLYLDYQGSSGNQTNDVITYKSIWAHRFLNEDIYNLFPEETKKVIAKTEKQYNVTTIEPKEYVPVSQVNGEYNTETDSAFLFIPSAKELGLGDEFHITENEYNIYSYIKTPLDINFKTIGSTYPLYAENSKEKVLNGKYYFLRDSYYNNDGDNYDRSYTKFLSTSSNGLAGKPAFTKGETAPGILFGMNIEWDINLQNIDDCLGANPEMHTIEADTFIESTYAVDLPEKIALADGHSTFEYSVSGDVNEDKKVVVFFPLTAQLEHEGVLSQKDDITLNISNPKTGYNFADCADGGTTTTVSIDYKVPSSGHWVAHIPVSISICSYN